MPTNDLERTKLEAQRTANRDGKAVVVLNLNRVGVPLYVIRDFSTDARNSERCVWVAYPSTADQGG